MRRTQSHSLHSLHSMTPTSTLSPTSPLSPSAHSRTRPPSNISPEFIQSKLKRLYLSPKASRIPTTNPPPLLPTLPPVPGSPSVSPWPSSPRMAASTPTKTRHLPAIDPATPSLTPPPHLPSLSPLPSSLTSSPQLRLHAGTHPPPISNGYASHPPSLLPPLSFAPLPVPSSLSAPSSFSTPASLAPPPPPASPPRPSSQSARSASPTPLVDSPAQESASLTQPRRPSSPATHFSHRALDSDDNPTEPLPPASPSSPSTTPPSPATLPAVHPAPELDSPSNRQEVEEADAPLPPALPPPVVTPLLPPTRGEEEREDDSPATASVVEEEPMPPAASEQMTEVQSLEAATASSDASLPLIEATPPSSSYPVAWEAPAALPRKAPRVVTRIQRTINEESESEAVPDSQQAEEPPTPVPQPQRREAEEEVAADMPVASRLSLDVASPMGHAEEVRAVVSESPMLSPMSMAETLSTLTSVQQPPPPMSFPPPATFASAAPFPPMQPPPQPHPYYAHPSHPMQSMHQVPYGVDPRSMPAYHSALPPHPLSYSSHPAMPYPPSPYHAAAPPFYHPPPLPYPPDPSYPYPHQPQSHAEAAYLHYVHSIAAMRDPHAPQPHPLAPPYPAPMSLTPGYPPPGTVSAPVHPMPYPPNQFNPALASGFHPAMAPVPYPLPPPPAMPTPSASSSTSSSGQARLAFFSNIRNNRVAEVQEQLLQGLPVHVVDRQGSGPLHLACQVGSKRMVKTLLRWGCDVNAQNYQGNTALHYCFAYHFDPLAAYLISKGADDRKLNYFGLSCYDGLKPDKREDAVRAVHEHANLLPTGLTEEMVLRDAT